MVVFEPTIAFLATEIILASVFPAVYCGISFVNCPTAGRKSNTLDIKRKVTVGYQPEQMVIHNGKLYVANSGGYR
ncbi:hypothetical protein ABXT06_22430, partial [Flavobacterium sp. UW10123]